MKRNVNVWDYIMNNWGNELSKLTPTHLKQLLNLIIGYQIMNIPPKSKNQKISDILMKMITIIDNQNLFKNKMTERNKRNISKRWNTNCITNGNTSGNTNCNRSSTKSCINNTSGNTKGIGLLKEKEKVVLKEKENILEYNNIYNNNIYKYNNNIYNIKEKEIYKEKEKVEHDFDVRFFDKYPKQVNRLSALQIWFDIFKELVYNEENYVLLLNNISNGLDNWLRYEGCWKEPNSKFVMNPTKWLTNKNWNRKFKQDVSVSVLSLEEKKEKMRRLGYKVV